MNLMFYDFNGSSMGSVTNTAQNFYKPSSGENGGVLSGAGGPEGSKDDMARIKEELLPHYRGDGDRVPTRERGYRSANQNFRRRDMQKKQQMAANNGGDMLPPGETSNR